MRDPETNPMPDWAGACSGLSSDEKEPETGDEIKSVSTSRVGLIPNMQVTLPLQTVETKCAFLLGREEFETK